MAGLPSSTSLSGSLSSTATAPASSSTTVAAPYAATVAAPYAATAAPPSVASSSPFVFGTASSTHHGTSPHQHQFAHLFSSAAPTPAPAPATPRHPIFQDHISNHIKFLPNPAEHNYNKWESFFLMVLIRYGVSFLIEHPPSPNANAHYQELDAHVVLWSYSTLTGPLLYHVTGATTTFAIWK
ncbi:hypothetical protein D1007_07295 [Hordeum vulgare]|nr:hypothetical protein D1007_07295 [Hordeum vulgare]